MTDNTDVIIKCPACGCDMHKIYMPEAGVNLDVCIDGCGGIYFDNREFLKFEEPHEDISPLEKAFENKTFKEVDKNETRYCPVCGNVMIKNYASARHEIQVDECYSCGGKFLDHSELEAIRAQYETEEERASEVMKSLYRNVGLEIEDLKTRHNNLNKKTGLFGVFSKKQPSILTKAIRVRYK